MATVTGYNAARMKQIEDETIVDGDIVGNDLVLKTRAGAAVNAGNVRGPQGTPGLKGDTGDPGPTGPAGTITGATASGLATGASPTVTLGGTPSARTLALGIPAGATGAKGDTGATGATGPAGTITSATASALAAGAAPTVTLGGTASARTFALGIPAGAKGDTGATGPSGTITSASASGLAAGAAPTVTLGGTPEARTFALGIPAGTKGDTGATGPSGTITSATATGLAAGAAPTVTLGGTPEARTIALGIPAGATGAKGDTGATGATGTVVIAYQAPTVTPNSYATGISVFHTTNETGWPAGYGIVTTTKSTGTRTHQRLVTNTGVIYDRVETSADVWSSWTQIATKTYVDGIVVPKDLVTGTDLNSLTTTGNYAQNQNVDATLALNYPVVLAGLIEVFHTGSMIYQRYTPYQNNSKNFYVRSWYSSAWSTWHKYTSEQGRQAFVDVTYVSGWASYKSIVPAATSGHAKYRTDGDLGELIGGWVGRTASLTLTAGTYYTGIFGTLAAAYRPLELQASVGQIALAGAPQPVQWRINPDGVIGFIPSIGGTWAANVSNSYMWIPSMRWELA